LNKTPKNLTLLESLYGTLEPGDVFMLLNDKTEHVVVIIFEDGVIDQEGDFIRRYRPVRYPVKNVRKLKLDYRFFESENMEIDLDGDSVKLELGSVIVRFDRKAIDDDSETISAEFFVIGAVDEEEKFYLTTNGEIVLFNDNNFLFTGLVYTDDDVTWTRRGLRKLAKLEAADAEKAKERTREDWDDFGLRGEQD